MNLFMFSALLCICYIFSSRFFRAIYGTNVHIEQTCEDSTRVHEYFVGVAYRLGVILASECSLSFLTEIMAAIFDFNGSGSLGKEINFYKGAVDGQQ